jgi:toxin-antitoxin system PIN domain toxin
MLLPDVNVLVHAHREDAPNHERYREWLESTLAGESAFGVCDLVLSGFLRVATHPRVFAQPTPLDVALQFVDDVRGRPNCVVVDPGPRHWGIFRRLCQSAGVRGNLVPDAFLAALAIEHGMEWITTDRDFSRFEGLRWRHPLTG